MKRSPDGSWSRWLACLVCVGLPLATRAQSAPPVQLLEATYGQNRWRYTGGSHIDGLEGNFTAALNQYIAANCAGRSTCVYVINGAAISDPSPGQTKDFSVRYDCGGSTHWAAVPPEASGQTLTLDCTSNSITNIVSATWGANCGADFDNERANLSSCLTQASCNFALTTANLTAHAVADPCSGHRGTKDVTVQYQCNNDPAYLTVTSPTSENGEQLTLSCVGVPRPANPQPTMSRACPVGQQPLAWPNGTNQSMPLGATMQGKDPGKNDCTYTDGKTKWTAPCQSVPVDACLGWTETDSNAAPPAHKGDLPVPENLTGTVNEPGCSPANPARCPTIVTLPPTQTPTAPEPTWPVQPALLPQPSAYCTVGTGYSFENGAQGWIAGNDFVAGTTPIFFGGFSDTKGRGAKWGPVYGNAVSIADIMPPGWNTANTTTLANVGGDYWEFSRDIGYQGKYWISSQHIRPDWTWRPGMTLGPSTNFGYDGTGTLLSPVCQLDSKVQYLDFLIGGGTSTSQRIELLVQDPTGVFAGSYQGIYPYSGVDPRAFSTAANQQPPVNMPYPSAAAQSAMSYVEAPPMSVPQLPVEKGWSVVFATTAEATPPGDSDSLRRRVVWNVGALKLGQSNIRIRIVDDQRIDSALWDKGYINADDFRFDAKPPAGTTWLYATKADQNMDVRKCLSTSLLADCPAALNTASYIGQAAQPQKLWGTTDVHAHVAANMSFNGHFIWGDPSDDLKHVYYCGNPLPSITDPNTGTVTRPSTPLNDGSVSTTAVCRLNGDISIEIAGIGSAACTVLGSIPFVGWALAAECVGVVAAALAAVTQIAALDGTTYHGASKIASGAIHIWSFLAQSLGMQPVNLDGFISIADPGRPMTDQGSHSPQGLGKTHQQYQKDMIIRAVQGGLRLVVADVNNSRVAELALDGAEPQDDWQAIYDNVTAVKRLVGPACAGAPSASYLLSSYAGLACTPSDVSTLVGQNRTAIILGTEVDELGKQRPNCASCPTCRAQVTCVRTPTICTEGTAVDCVEQQVEDLYAMGIRKVTPIHAVNNPIGGAAIYGVEPYNTLNYYLSATRAADGGAHCGHWEGWNPLGPGPVVVSLAALALPWPFAALALGDWDPGKRLVLKPAEGSHRADNSCGLWNGPLKISVGLFGSAATIWQNDGWFTVETTGWAAKQAAADQTTFASPQGRDFIGGYNQLSWRFGFGSSGAKSTLTNPSHLPQMSAALDAGSNSWFSLSQLNDEPIVPVRLQHIGWLAGGATSLSSNCDLQDVLFPEKPASIPVIDSHYLHADMGHQNQLGLTGTIHLSPTDGVGVRFIWRLMERGMIVDLDHLSQKTRLDVYEYAQAFGNLASHTLTSGYDGKPVTCAGNTSCAGGLDYPLAGVHSYLRGLDRGGAEVAEYRTEFGTNTESDRPPIEAVRVAQNGGVFAPIMNATAVDPRTSKNLTGQSGPGGWTGWGVNWQGLLWDPYTGSGMYGMPLNAPWEVNNDCDRSSKSWATKYLVLLQLMGWKGITPSTDMNGLTTPMTSRYGLASLDGRACLGGQPESTGAVDPNHPGDWRRDFHPSYNSGALKCEFSSARGWDPNCPSYQMVMSQYSEASGVWYDQYDAPVNSALSPGQPFPAGSNSFRVNARDQFTNREDGAPRFGCKCTLQNGACLWTCPPNFQGEYVAYSKGVAGWNDDSRNFRQRRALAKWSHAIAGDESGSAPRDGWDFNLDGFKHIGLYPDFLQDLRNIGLTPEQLGPLFNSANDYYSMWNRACTTAKSYASQVSASLPTPCQ